MSKGTGGQDAGTGADRVEASGSRATQPLSPQMPAPHGRFVHQADDGTITDVTEGVQRRTRGLQHLVGDQRQ